MSEHPTGERRDGRGRSFREIDYADLEGLKRVLSLHHENTGSGDFDLRTDDETIVGLGEVRGEGENEYMKISLSDEMWKKWDEHDKHVK